MILGEKPYLRLVSRIFLFLHRSGFLRTFKKFQTHYLVKKLIKKGDTIIDIGANLGYYSSIFATQTGKEGKVLAVEPIPLYRKILISNTRRFGNVDIIPFGLGENSGEATMGIPSKNKFRHGLTRVLDNNDDSQIAGYRVTIKSPESLFSDLPRLDYIKCDIEGYEDKVIPGFQKLINKFTPIIQIELEKSNFDSIDDYLIGLNYKRFIVSGRKLVSLDSSKEYSSDIIYIPGNRVVEFSGIIH